ncbi:PIN domain [Trinorchestia longiramus]|nr:PIN domain [Trinorchestia longiramus]
MMLVIPHTVIRELDLLKKDSKCQIEAQFAVKWINRMLEQSVCAAADENFVNGAHNVCGQSLKNYNELRDSTDDKNGDDRILDYCLWLKQRGLKVLLLSNDINFRNKAIFAEVPSVGSKNLKEDLTWADELSAAVHLDQSFKVQCHQRSSSSPNLENGMQSQSVVHSEHADASDVHMNDISLNNFVNENTNGTNHLSTSNSKLPNTSSVSEKTASSCNPSSKSVCSSLRMTLSNILTERMKSVFSDLWLSIVIRKPPWNLHDLFVCWKKHWVAVFTDIFPSELQTDLKLFQRMLRFKSSEEELYQQMCKIYGSLSTENFRDLIVYPQKDSIEGKLNKSFSNNPEVLDANLSIVTHPVDQNSNNISTTNTTILAYNSKQESLSEIHSPVSQLSSSGISNHCLSTNVLQIHPLQTSSYQSPSFSNDDSTWRNTHGKTDETSINKSCHLDGTSLCWDQDFVDARTVADAHKAFIATGEKMRALVCEGLSSISRAEGPYRTEVLASLLNLKLCISTFRAALTRCHDDPSAASNFHHLRSAIVEFWENVHEERNSSAQVFNSMTGAVAASALFRSKEEGFWLTCLKHLWEMETALNAELPVESQLQ